MEFGSAHSPKGLFPLRSPFTEDRRRRHATRGPKLLFVDCTLYFEPIKCLFPLPSTPGIINSQGCGFVIYIHDWHITQILVKIIHSFLKGPSFAPTVVSNVRLDITCQGLGMGTNELPTSPNNSIAYFGVASLALYASAPNHVLGQ